MRAMAGLLSFAWWTSMLFSMAQGLTDEALREYRKRRKAADHGAD
jgi:hypothetical protein